MVDLFLIRPSVESGTSTSKLRNVKSSINWHQNSSETSSRINSSTFFTSYEAVGNEFPGKYPFRRCQHWYMMKSLGCHVLKWLTVAIVQKFMSSIRTYPTSGCPDVTEPFRVEEINLRNSCRASSNPVTFMSTGLKYLSGDSVINLCSWKKWTKKGGKCGACLGRGKQSRNSCESGASETGNHLI